MKISISASVNSDLDTVWACWNNPADIKQWCAAADDWHTTDSSVDLRVGGKFSFRMEAKDGSTGFDFAVTYIKMIENTLIEYVMADSRSVSVEFVEGEGGVSVIEIFDAEGENEPEQQRQGWQNILNNFAKYVESKV
ncbi:MAG: SRPBCC domain-containing protein [Methylococcales bacterium]|nr:SRPBCC domain-containing protein [Methylococcales bacterium]